MAAGLFITFEGIDGCGKSTQIELFREKLLSEGRDVVLLREPGGTRIGESIRPIVLDHDNGPICVETELLLFLAARAQIVREVIQPLIASGTIVICDRFIDSTVAYQGFGRNIGKEVVDRLNRFAIDDTVPDITFLLDLDPVIAYNRISSRDQSKDRLDSEGIDFFTKVRYGYSRITAEDPKRIKVLDAQGSVDDISQEIFRIFKEVTK